MDLANNPRYFDDLAVANTGTGTGAIVDRGAYERQEPSATPCPADINSSGSVDALDLATLLNNWNTEIDRAKSDSPSGNNGTGAYSANISDYQ